MQAVEEVQQPALDEPPAWRRVWHELVTPSTALERPEERRRAALTLGVISTLSGLGTMLAVISVIDMIQDGVTPESIALLGWMTVFLALLPGLHKLARGPKHSWAAFLTVLTTWGTVLFFHVSAPMGQASIGLLHLAIPLFLSTVLLPPSATLFLGGSAVASTLLFPWLLDQGPVSMEAVAFFVAFTWLAVPIHRMREHDLAQIQAQAERLKESELRNRQMLHATFEGVVVHRGMEVVDANPTFAALFGLEHDQVAGTHMGTLLSAQGGERLDTLLLERHGMAWEATGMDVLGSKFPVECRSRDIEYSGETLRVTALRDITERRAVEAERTRVAEEAARRAELEQLVWLTSHALRTPVRTVNSFTQLLERDHSAGLGEDALEALSFIRAGSREMDALLGDLRTFAELTTRPTTRELVDVGHILTTVKGELTDLMQARRASVGHRELPIVRADPVQVYHLIKHVMENALTYADDEQPWVRVRASRLDASWLFQVEDNGPGIPQAQRERAFQIFQRLDLERDGERTGLGLALAKRVVELHGGKIWLEDDLENGVGTRVCFTLPAAELRQRN